jgi:lysophospholipase L1-like esterase
MASAGWPGEAIGTGLTRLPSAIAESAPEALLLLDGANDLLGEPSSATTQYIATKLRDMIRAAKRSKPGIRVFLANFPPQYHPTPAERGTENDRGKGADFVPELNQRIAAVAAEEGADLVDLYSPMSGNVKAFISRDGLHPTLDGYRVMAGTFRDVIQLKLETAGISRR